MALGVIICCMFILKYGELAYFDNYENISIYDLTVYHEQNREWLYGYYMISRSVAFYNTVTNQAIIPLKVIVMDRSREDFEKKLKHRHIQYSYILHESWNKFISVEGQRSSSVDLSRNFLTYGTILQWVARKMAEYPKNVQVKSLTIQTYEKRDITSLRISQNRAKKISVYVVGGENSRDWMSVAVIMNYMDRLIKTLTLQTNSKEMDSSRESSLNNILDFYNMYFVPVTNPDGYVFNMESISGRLWTKNRNNFIKKVCDHGENAIGVNVDRNWKIPQVSGIDLECSGIYLGPGSLSEVETYSLFRRLNFKAQQLMAVVIVKGFGKMITLPYAEPKLTSNHDLMMQILSSVTAELRARFNETFLYGTTGTYLYNYTGNMADYLKEKLNIPVVINVHLQRGENFLPDVDDIDILTNEFQVILENVLMPAKDIYGSLFNYDFEYFVVQQPPPRICFGTGLEREAMPISGPCLESFMKHYTPEQWPNLTPCTYMPGRDAFYELTHRHISKYGLGAKAPRFWTKHEYQPPLRELLPPEPWKQNCAPFNSTAKRKNVLFRVTDYPAPCNYLPDYKKRQMKFAYSFQGKKHLICPVQIKCVPYNLDECGACGCLCSDQGDYWQFEDRVFLCRRHYTKFFDHCLAKFQGIWLSEFKPVRDCFFAHAHNSCKAAVKIMKNEEIEKKLRKEAYLDLYFPLRRFCNR